MERKKLKKYKMAVGMCGPTVLYTNIIRAYTAEEAVRIYYEEKKETPTEAMFQQAVRHMREVEEEKALEKYFDVRLQEISIGDHIYAIAKNDAERQVIVEADVKGFTKRGMKIVSGEKEMLLLVRKDDKEEVEGETVSYFSMVIKADGIQNTSSSLSVGDKVVYMYSPFAASIYAFRCGTVTKVTPSYIYIDDGKEETRKTAERVLRISE